MDLHYPAEMMSKEDVDYVRALTSLKEEIEAVSWYHQREATTSDPTIKGVVRHNKEEEMEHAAMLLEWLRRHMPGWDKALRTYLFTEGDLLAIEEGSQGSSSSPSGLGIGKIKR